MSLSTQLSSTYTRSTACRASDRVLRRRNGLADLPLAAVRLFLCAYLLRSERLPTYRASNPGGRSQKAPGILWCKHLPSIIMDWTSLAADQ